MFKAIKQLDKALENDVIQADDSKIVHEFHKISHTRRILESTNTVGIDMVRSIRDSLSRFGREPSF
jgi:hypothetical protein